jgi:hypothetical protein
MAHLTRFALRSAVLVAVAAVLFAPLPAAAQTL